MTNFFKNSVRVALCMLFTACGGSQDTGAHFPPRCGASADATVLTGTVTAVHDGDSLTLQIGTTTELIRLQGIDAPEMAQVFGDAAKQALKRQTFNQTVHVAYTHRDRYDRLLGQVFSTGCSDVNQQMLHNGLAWFYTAYACELDSQRRVLYESAQTQARAQKLGLWRQREPIAPWVFRNGQDTPGPSC